MASTLKQGAKGDEVKQLQELLNAQGAGLKVDGIYGPLTAAAVSQYQTSNSLKVDGITGSQTWGSLLGGGGGGGNYITDPAMIAMLDAQQNGGSYGGSYSGGGGFYGGGGGGSPGAYTPFEYQQTTTPT